MRLTPRSRVVRLGAVACSLVAAGGLARAADAADPAERLNALQRLVNEQSARLDALRRSVAQEEARLDEVERTLGQEVLASQRARGLSPDALAQATPPESVPSSPSARRPSHRDGPRLSHRSSSKQGC